MLKSTVSGWWSTFMYSGVPQVPQNPRWPNALDVTVLIASAPCRASQSPLFTLAKAIAGEPLFSWQVRQWHQPASNGALCSSKRTVPQRQPPVIFPIICRALGRVGGTVN